MSQNPFLSTLNDEQRAAVTAPAGPVLVVAGAGTGKTRTLTHRIGHVIHTGLCLPDEILAVTFSKKASGEMRERLTDMLGHGVAESIRIGSFHAVSGGMVRQHPTAVGLQNHQFTVLDEEDQRSVLATVADQMSYLPAGQSRGQQVEARSGRLHELNNQIQAWKEAGLSPAALQDDPRIIRSHESQKVLDVYRGYQETLARRNVCDYADLLLHMTTLMDRSPDVKQYWQTRFKYVLVDEFQDTNKLQYKWINQVAGGHRNLFAVGDSDQSIYRWRGADPEIFQQFARDWPETKTFALQQNYRSTQQILDAANVVVEPNPRPIPKVLRSNKTGAPIVYTSYANHLEEAQGIATLISEKIQAGRPASSIAILPRSRRQILDIERALLDKQVPFEVVNEQTFVRRDEIRDAHAYLTLAIQPNSELAFLRVFNKPERGIDEHTAWLVIDTQRRNQGLTYADACKQVADTPNLVNSNRAAALHRFATTLDTIHDLGRNQTLAPGDMAEHVLGQVGYMAWRVSIGDKRANEQEEALRIMIDSANTRTDVSDYLQNAPLDHAFNGGTGKNAVKIMTIHGSKGLEFDMVIAPGCEEGVQPNRKSMQTPYGLAEERNTTHVQWSRAREELYISSARQRDFKYSQPSRFLVEAGLVDAAELERDIIPSKNDNKVQGSAEPKLRRSKAVWR